MTRDTRSNITNPQLDRITSDADYAESRGVIRFHCDHSMSLVTHKADGKIIKDLLFDGRCKAGAGPAAHLLQHASPRVMRELVRGYRHAKANGLPEFDTLPRDSK